MGRHPSCEPLAPCRKPRCGGSASRGAQPRNASRQKSEVAQVFAGIRGTSPLFDGDSVDIMPMSQISKSAAMAIFCELRADRIVHVWARLAPQDDTQHQVECEPDSTCHDTARTKRAARHQHGDTLACSFHVDAFVHKLVKILDGTGNAPEDDHGDHNDDTHEQDEDAHAAVLALSGGGQYRGDNILEAQVFAARSPCRPTIPHACRCRQGPRAGFRFPHTPPSKSLPLPDEETIEYQGALVLAKKSKKSVTTTAMTPPT